MCVQDLSSRERIDNIIIIKWTRARICVRICRYIFYKYHTYIHTYTYYYDTFYHSFYRCYYRRRKTYYTNTTVYLCIYCLRVFTHLGRTILRIWPTHSRIWPQEFHCLDRCVIFIHAHTHTHTPHTHTHTSNAHKHASCIHTHTHNFFGHYVIIYSYFSSLFIHNMRFSHCLLCGSRGRNVNTTTTLLHPWSPRT